jgi:hypothetical protein
MRRQFDYEVEQGLVDEQESDILALTDKIQRREEKSPTISYGVEKEIQLGEEAAVPIPLAPRSWLRTVAYTRTGLVAVPKKPYHQQAQFVGVNNTTFDISYSPLFPQLDTIQLPGDRTTTIKVYAGQEVWMRATVLDGYLSVIIEPYLGDQGQTLTTEGNGYNKPMDKKVQ